METEDAIKLLKKVERILDSENGNPYIQRREALAIIRGK